MRNPVLISHLDPENHEWAKKFAKQLTETQGQRTTMSDLLNQGLKLVRQKYEDEEALEKAKSEKEPWLERVPSAH